MTKLTHAQLREGAHRIVEILQNAGYTAYWAGGCVRDMLMERRPKDYDIATSATPDQMAAIFPRSIPVGKAFGVMQTPWHGHYYEVATFRKDSRYRDGRRPDFVVFTNAESDAQRRDFTINAMFFDPVSGKLHDYVNGRDDLQARRLRAVGDPPARFAEDHLRMLRAVRFAATLDFQIDEATIAAIKAHSGKITLISVERVQIELTRTMLESARGGNAIRMLSDLSLLRHILPEVEALRGQEQPPQFHPEGDVFTHTEIMLNNMRDPSSRLAWAILFHDIGKPATCRVTEQRLRFDGHATIGARMAGDAMRRLRMSNEDIKTITYCVANHMRFMEVQKMKRSTLIRLVSAPTFPIELELHRLDCLASHGDLGNYNFLRDFIRARAAEPKLPPALITGHDLLALDLRGSAIGDWKKAAYEAQLNNQFSDKEGGLKWLRQQLPAGRRGLQPDN